MSNTRWRLLNKVNVQSKSNTERGAGLHLKKLIKIDNEFSYYVSLVNQNWNRNIYIFDYELMIFEVETKDINLILEEYIYQTNDNKKAIEKYLLLNSFKDVKKTIGEGG